MSERDQDQKGGFPAKPGQRELPEFFALPVGRSTMEDLRIIQLPKKHAAVRQRTNGHQPPGKWKILKPLHHSPFRIPAFNGSFPHSRVNFGGGSLPSQTNFTRTWQYITLEQHETASHLSMMLFRPSVLRSSSRQPTHRAHAALWQSSAACALALACGPCAMGADVRAEQPSPNFLVVMADDLGFSDLGSFGSEIATPNLDRLAQGGVRLTHFYNTAKCAPSRVSLLTGMWSNRAGNNSMRHAVTIPEILMPAGYFTAMTGKWHLQKEPTDFGFQRYFGHLSGATDYFKGNDTFRLNGKPFQVPESGFYTTTAIVDHALDFLAEAREEKKPWFLYIAPNAPHAPIQPLLEDYEKYLGRYESGWDESHAQRVKNQQQLGLFPDHIKPAPRPSHIPAWQDLAPETRDWEARRRAAYAALVHRLDIEIGRVLADIEKHGELENTLIIFLSDNGANPFDRRNIGADRPPYEPGIAWSSSTGWAWVSNTPFRLYKQNQFEGGIVSPTIAHWPRGILLPPGSIVPTQFHISDILPTIAAAAGIPIPGEFKDRELRAMTGISMLPVFQGSEPAHRPALFFQYVKDRALLMNDGWKIVSFRDQPWELYNLVEDRTELVNLADQQPERLKKMVAEWYRMGEEEVFLGSRWLQPFKESAGEQISPEWSNYSPGVGTKTGGAGRGRTDVVAEDRDDD